MINFISNSYSKNKRNVFIIIIFFLLFLVLDTEIVMASSFFGSVATVPTFIQIYLLINILLIFIINAMLFEIQKKVHSKIWNSIFIGNFVDIFYALSLGVILSGLYLTVNLYILILIAFFYTIATTMVVVTVYHLITPIMKERVNITKIGDILFYALSLIVWLGLIKVVPYLKYPIFRELRLLYLFLFLFLLLVIYFGYVCFRISEGYKNLGFVRIPFFAGVVGTIAIILSVILMMYSIKDFNAMYYYIIFCFTAAAFVFIYYFRFVIEYPSLLQPKWKALLPFDLVKVATSVTLAFLGISVFYTVREYPNFTIYQNVSYIPLLVFLGVVFIPIMFISGYIRVISDKTNLRYWNYLKIGLFIHIVATFYVFGLIALLWNSLAIKTKVLSTLFGLFALAFYVLYALDMHIVISDLNIKFSFNKIDISRYFVSLYSLFFLIYFGTSFTYGRTVEVFGGMKLESYPIILFFIAVFLVVFTTYLSASHKGFEEIMKKNVWSELSYLATFVTFIFAFLLYISVPKVKLFPLHDMFFVGYFIVLIIETYAISTLGVRSKYERGEEYAITNLLNFVASHFLRSDYLADIWEKNIDKYVDPTDLGKTRFEAATRRFDINELDKETRNRVATAMLFDMYHLSTQEKVAVVANDFYETLKKDIDDALQEEILLLPEELRTNFDEEKYYPVLFEKLVNDLTERIKTFVPSVEHKILFEQLSRISTMFADSTYDGSKIQIPPETRFSRGEFIEYFKSYLNSLEELFPFEETLLYGPIKRGIKEEILTYGFSIEDLLDLVPIGIEKLDEITDGGLLRKTSTLILSEDTRHKKEFLMSFLKQGLKDRDRILLATSKEPSKNILNELRKEFLELGELTILDLYQDIHTSEKLSNIIEKKNRIIIPTSTVFARQSIVKTIKKYPKDSHKRVILDVLNDLLRYFRYEELSTIIYQLLDGLRKWNCTTLLTLDPSLMTNENLEEMEKKFENILVFSGKGVEESIMIKKLHGGTPKHKIISFH